MAQSEHELVERVREGDTLAFEMLSACYREPLRRHLLRTVRDPDAADDLLQEVFLRLWTRADQWDGRGSFKAWLFRIALNLALNHLRTIRRRRQQPLEPPVELIDDEEDSTMPGALVDTVSLGPEIVLEQAEQRALLRQLVGGLPAEKREVFRLVHDAEMGLREAADLLGIPEGTAKSRLHYANKRLAREWKALTTEWEEQE
jgi:RNA polymerase sigma-70 factor (ECF subfamily)